MNVHTYIGFGDAEEELKRMEEFRKARIEVEKKEKRWSGNLILKWDDVLA